MIFIIRIARQNGISIGRHYGHSSHLSKFFNFSCISKFQENIQDGIDFLMEVDCWVGHNLMYPDQSDPKSASLLVKTVKNINTFKDLQSKM